MQKKIKSAKILHWVFRVRKSAKYPESKELTDLCKFLSSIC